MSQAKIPHIRSSVNVTVYLDGRPNVVSAGTAQYDLVIKALDAGDEQGVRDAINVRQAVVNLSQGKITLDGTTLQYDGRPLHGALVNRILGVVKAAGNAGPLLLFLENLMENPSKRAVDELYKFMEKNDLPVTSDGHFLAYKKVRSDYKSIHDGKTDNSIGTSPSVPRNTVDEDKSRTCSSGLHFCSRSYLPHFGGGEGNRIVVVKINPRDVVAIPDDYNQAKGRACTYQIVGELNTSGGRDVVAELSASFEAKYDPAAPAADAVPAPLASDTGKTAPKVALASKPAPGTTAKQAQPGQSTLTDAQVREIRDLLSQDWPLASIAKVVGTSPRTVARIRDGETYTHVK